jgi:hypothetical protein
MAEQKNIAGSFHNEIRRHLVFNDVSGEYLGTRPVRIMMHHAPSQNPELFDVTANDF